MCCVLLCILEAVEGGFCLPEVPEVTEVMRCVLLCMEAVEGGLSFAVSKFPLCQFSHCSPPPLAKSWTANLGRHGRQDSRMRQEPPLPLTAGTLVGNRARAVGLIFD